MSSLLREVIILMLNLTNGNLRIKERNSISVEKKTKREDMTTEPRVSIVIRQIRKGNQVDRLKNVEEVNHVTVNRCRVLEENAKRRKVLENFI